MIVSVVSAHPRTGKTAFCVLLAQAIGYTQNMSTLLISTSPSSTMPEYVGIEPEEDLTAMVGQVVELVSAGAVHANDIPNYCKKLSPNCEFLDTSTEKFAREEMEDLVQTIATMSDRDIVVVECDKEPLKDSDVVFVTMNEDRESIRKSALLDVESGKAMKLFVVTKYNERIISLRDVAKELGVSYRFVAKFHLNEVVEKECRKGTLDTMIPYIIEKEPTVMNLNVDLKECIGAILSTVGQKVRWDG